MATEPGAGVPSTGPAEDTDVASPAPEGRRRRPRGAERDALTRAQMTPLADGERPLALRLSVALAAVIAIVNVLLALLGAGPGGDEEGGARLTLIVFVLLLGVDAAMMWRRSYWAVLAFEALVGLSILTAGLSLLVASNLAAAALCLVSIAVLGTLFWFLVRVMARLQLTEQLARGHDPRLEV